MVKIFMVMIPGILLASACIIKSVYQRSFSHQMVHKQREAIFSIDYYAYYSKINGWSPELKVGFSATLLLLSILLNDLSVSVLIILLTAYITIVLGGVSFEHYIKLLSIPIVFLILGSIAIAVNFSKVPCGDWYVDFHYFYIFVTKTGMLNMIHLWGKALGAVSAMYMMSLSTPSSEIFQVLSKVKVPKLIVELMNIMYRYIFILMDTQCKMKHAAESRLGYCDYRTSIQTFGNIGRNLFIVSLKKASNYFDAMESRCYDGEFRFFVIEKKITRRQIIGVIGVILYLFMIWLL